MRRVLLVFCVFSLIIPFNTASAISSYSDEQAWSKIHSSDPPLLVDVRDNSAYLAGHIPTAVNFPISNGIDTQTATNIQNYGKSEVITYCSCVDGSNARFFVERLFNLSVTNVFYMHDDFRYWPYDTVSGADPGTVTLELSNGVISGEGSELTFLFLIINLGLLSLVILLVIRKRRKS